MFICTCNRRSCCCDKIREHLYGCAPKPQCRTKKPKKNCGKRKPKQSCTPLEPKPRCCKRKPKPKPKLSCSSLKPKPRCCKRKPKPIQSCTPLEPKPRCCKRKPKQGCATCRPKIYNCPVHGCKSVCAPKKYCGTKRKKNTCKKHVTYPTNCKGKKPKKPKCCCKGKAFNREWVLSEELADFLGMSTAKRSDVIKLIWEYINDNDLRDPDEPKVIRADYDLAQIIGQEKFIGFTMMKHLNKHFLYERRDSCSSEYDACPKKCESREEKCNGGGTLWNFFFSPM